ncbi:MAG: OmpA family protein [Lentisphaeria bacterium]|nr:OmpA family protein [Lentisphaeria bacterium]
MFSRISVVGLVLSASVLLLVSGCKSKSLDWEADNDKNTKPFPVAVEDPYGGAIEGPTAIPQTPGGSNWTENPNDPAISGADKDGWVLADPSGKRLNMPVIYFAYDSDVLVASEMNKVRSIAQYMNENPQLALVIEGHCDQRGTEEYNRALGERRANAVRAALEANGVAADKMKTQSFGEDKPAVAGNDAASWRKNRRAVPVPMLLPR